MIHGTPAKQKRKNDYTCWAPLIGWKPLVVMTTMIKKIVPILIPVFLGYHSVAQTNQPIQIVNQLKIKIIDVVERNQLCDLNLIICNENDTINLHIDSTAILLFDLKFRGKYSATLIKEGYDTLSAEWNNSLDSTELILEFYMPKTTLTREEKRKAHSYSRDLPERPCDHCGGFQRITVGYNEMCVMRFRAFKNDTYSGSSYEFRKLKYY
ncbi:MAG: hypothetical protein ACO1N0_11155 [Fluviicola sp.]